MAATRIGIAAGASALALFAIVQSATADDAAPPDNAGGRYVFAKRGEAYLRLDTQTGDVSLCSQREVGWACAAAPDERAMLEDEIVRLRAENAVLKKDLVARGLPLPAGAEAPQAAAPDHQITVPLPSDAEIDRVVAYAGRLWHRFVDAVNRAQRQILNKS